MLVGGVVGLWFVLTERNSPPDQSSLTVEHLPEFVLPDLEDRPRSIAEWSGRSLFINFWATWCAPWRREMPLLQSLQDERSDGSLQVIGIAMDNLPDVKRFVAQAGVSYPILYGEHDTSIVAESFGDDFIGLPFSVFVGPGGDILALWDGEIHADDLRRIVAAMDAVASGRRSVIDVRQEFSGD